MNNRLNSKNRFFCLVLNPEIWPLLFFDLIIKEITPSENEVFVSSRSISFYLKMSHPFTSKVKWAGPIGGIWHAMPPGWSIRILSLFYGESLFYFFIVGHATDRPIIKSSSMKTNPKNSSMRISKTKAHYLINGQPLQLGLFLCNCRQARLTDGGRGTVLMGVDITGGVMLWINLRGEVSTEGCQTVAGSMHCRSRRSC